MSILSSVGILSVAGVGMCLLMNHPPFGQLAQAASPPKLNLQERAVSPQIKAATSLSPIVKRVSPSVVNIYTTKKVKMATPLMPFFDDPFFRQFFGDPWGGQGRVPQERREQALGSGVIVSEDGYLLTNNHVVDGADEIKVAMSDEKTVLEAKVIGTDPHTDIAVIKVEGKKLPAIAITDSDNVEVGDLVVRRRSDRHFGHREREGPRGHGDRGLRGFHPDRRLHQPGQQWRRVGGCGGPVGGHQHRYS